MLIEFSVGNYRSFKDPTTLSLVAANITSKNKSIDEENVVKVEKELSLLTSAAVYGANASGKSNLIAAVRFMRNFVLNSSKETQADEIINVEKFRLSVETDDRPTFFQMVFFLNGKKYRYGFEINTQQVVSEWLFYVPRSREAKLFERELDQIIVTDTFKEGKGIEGRTRDNALFLSVVAQFNGEIAKKILNWFRQLNINLGINDTSDHARAISRFDRTKDKEVILNFVKGLDLGIDNIKLEKEPVKLRSSLVDMAENLAKFLESVEGMEVPRIKTMHRKYDANGTSISQEIFDMEGQESEGTKRLFNLAVPVLDALRRGQVLFIDEIDARLHPLITCNIIGLFNDKAINTNNAQLVFTTHDTNLLNNKMFRRDQIWFVEKDKYGASHLYSLVEFKVRNDASFERDYVRGKYGAIPFIGSLQVVTGDDNE